MTRVFAAEDRLGSVVFSPDGSRVAAGGNKTVEMWDAASGRLLRTFKGHGDWVNTIAFSADGSRLLSASDDKTLKVWDISTGRLLCTMAGADRASSAAYARNSRWIVSGHADGVVRIWDAATCQRIVSLLATSDGEWLAITPEGFFAGTPKGAEMLSVVRGLDVFAIDQAYQSLYRPDLVREKMAGDTRGLVREAAAKLDLDKVISSGRAPDVEVTLPDRGLTAGDSITVDAQITDRGGGIGRIEWRVNGVTVGIDNPTAGAGLSTFRLTRSLTLEAGDNVIEVLAYNSANLVFSVPERVAIVVPPPVSAPGAAAASRLFVLAAASDNYADNRLQLQYSVADAKAVAQAFEVSGKDLYASVEVKVLSDPEVTPERLNAAFVELAKEVRPWDVFVLYLAGHGKTVDGRYYYAPQTFKVDGDLTDAAVEAAVKSQGIAQELWQRWFALIQAKKSVILFDTCESGTLAGDTIETKTLEQGAANDRLARATGRSIITASSGSAAAFEGYRGHGLFTYNLLDALDKGDGDKNGKIDVTELAAYVYAQVTDISERVFKQRQEPQMKINLNYPLTRQGRVLKDSAPALATQTKPNYQLAQAAKLQIKPTSGATVVRSLLPKRPVTVLKSEGGWSLVVSEGNPIGYVATRDLRPMQ